MSRSDQLSSDNDDRVEVGEVERPRGKIDRFWSGVRVITGELGGEPGVSWVIVEIILLLEGCLLKAKIFSRVVCKNSLSGPSSFPS